jgi:energy-coupling factor transporter ATP-binding protein EcfA2
MAGVRLKQLTINKYRNVAPGTTLAFNDGFNILLGKNGTGKTTLLKLIAMLVTDDLSPLKQQALDVKYALAFADADVEVCLKNARVGRKGIDPIFAWSYEVVVCTRNESASRHTIVAESSPPILKYSVDGSVQPTDDLPVVLPFDDKFLGSILGLLWALLEATSDARDIAARASLLMRKNKARGRFDEMLGGFEAISKTGYEPADGAPPPAQASFVSTKWGGAPEYWSMFVPEGLREAIDKYVDKLPETIALTQEQVAYLSKFVGLTGFRAGDMLLRRRRVNELHDASETRETVYGGFDFNFTLEDREIIGKDDLSYGQKRLLSFLYYAAANPDVIIADELVNGLHYEWIEACLKEIQGRQCFLTSQNPILLDMLPFASVEEVKRSFILCSHEVREGRGQHVWRNMADDSADAFFRAYERGGLQVSEILRTNDLW